MNGLYALTLILCVYACGDMIASKTKAIVSMMFVACIFFAVAFWNGLPPTIFTDSALKGLADVTVGLLLVNMGTTISLKELRKEWKTVLLVIFSSIAIFLGVYFIAGLFIESDYTIMGAPVLGGGIVAFLVMSEKMAQTAGPQIVAFGSLLLVAHSVIGLPIASVLCKKEALRLQDEIGAGRLSLANAADVGGAGKKRRLFPAVPAKYNGPNLIIAKVALIACLSSWLSGLTGGKLNMLVICLVLGVVFREMGFLEESPLNLSGSFTLIIGAVLVNAFVSLAQTTPSMVLSMLKPLSIVIGIGVVCCILIAIVVGKALKMSWYMSAALGIAALIGFPGTLIVSTEVSKATAKTVEEEAVILQNIMPKMIIAGMVSVSVISVVVASLVVNLL